jgi:hypothetical protein
MLVAEDAAGVTHTDAVLRALSYYREGALSLYEIFLRRVGQPYVREAMDESQRKYEDTPDDRTNALGEEMRRFVHGLFIATCVDWFAEHKKARERAISDERPTSERRCVFRAGSRARNRPQCLTNR